MLQQPDHLPLVRRRGGQERRHRHDVRLARLDLLHEPVDLDVHPQVDDREAVRGQHGADDPLADVVDVALDRARQDVAHVLALRVALRQLGLEDGERRLHRLGAHHQLRQEQLAGAESIADDPDALHEPVVDRVERHDPQLQRLAREGGRILRLARDDAGRHLFVQVGVLHVSVLLSLHRAQAMARGVVGLGGTTRL